MLAYNRTWLDAIQIQTAAQYYMNRSVISSETAHAIRDGHPVGFYSPNWFIRIGLAIFGWVMIMAGVGMLFLLLPWESDTLTCIKGILIGVGLLFFLETGLIRKSHHYRSGLDDIFAYSGVGAILTGLFVVTNSWPMEINLMIWAVVGGIAAIRYADTPLTLFAVGCLTLVVFILVSRAAGENAMLLLPVTGMLCAGFWYFLSGFLQKRTALRYWQTPLQWIEAAALLLFYASGNFWCIRFFAKKLFDTEQVPLQSFFWAFTFAIPVVYIVLGLYRKDRLLLDIGIFCVAAALATVRYFYQIMPFERAITLIGAICVALAWLSIRYLKTNHRWFTYIPDERQTDIQQLQNKIVGQM